MFITGDLGLSLAFARFRRQGVTLGDLSDKGFRVFSMGSMMTLKAERCCQAF